jgi:glutathione S-transferase
MLKLYVAPLSANSHKIALFLSVLGVPHEIVDMDYTPDSLGAADYLARNPRGQVPMIEVDGRRIWDSQAILVYLARAHGGEAWLPLDPLGMAEVMQWLALAQNEQLYGIAQARIARTYPHHDNLVHVRPDRSVPLAHRGLRTMEARLRDHDWLALDRATIAEMACFSYPALTAEAGIAIGAYRAVTAWLKRVQALPGYVGMPGIA